MTGIGDPRLSADEVEVIPGFVAPAGGLIVLGETEQDKYDNNLNELLESFGLRLANDTVQDYEHCLQAPSWVLAKLEEGARGGERRSPRARTLRLPVSRNHDHRRRHHHRQYHHRRRRDHARPRAQRPCPRARPRHRHRAGRAAYRLSRARPRAGGGVGRLRSVRR